MEVIAWLWLYDKRWLFGIKPPGILSVWAVPLIQNIIFLTIVAYFTRETEDECYKQYDNIKLWVSVRFYILSVLIIGIFWIFLETLASRTKENESLKQYKKANPALLRKHNFWLRRKVLVSFPGLAVLLVGFFNYWWTANGITEYYENYEIYTDPDIECSNFVNLIVYSSMYATAVLSLPVVWVLFWMVVVKVVCLLLSLLCPSVLIAIKKCFMSFDKNNSTSNYVAPHRVIEANNSVVDAKNVTK